MDSLSEGLSAVIIFLAVLLAHLFKFRLFLLQLKTQLILDLHDFGFFVFIEGATMVLYVCPHLLAQLHDSLVDVFVGIFFNHLNVGLVLLVRVFSLKKFVIFNFELLLSNAQFLVKIVLQVNQCVLMFLFQSHFVMFKLRHDFSFKLFSLQFNIFPREFLLLQKPQLFGFLALADILSNSAISLTSQLLPHGVHLPIETLFDLV